MCGICGKVNFNSQGIQDSLLSRMSRSFSYRGPDDEGIYIGKVTAEGAKQHPVVGFGHQRLSIIDLSDAGHQPMSNEDGTIWITYNGEIYNYRELAEELKNKGHHFKSDTDTEVILHLYEEEGTNAVNRLNGFMNLTFGSYSSFILQNLPDMCCILCETLTSGEVINTGFLCKNFRVAGVHVTGQV